MMSQVIVKLGIIEEAMVGIVIALKKIMQHLSAFCGYSWKLFQNTGTLHLKAEYFDHLAVVSDVFKAVCPNNGSLCQLKYQLMEQRNDEVTARLFPAYPEMSLRSCDLGNHSVILRVKYHSVACLLQGAYA